MSEANGEYPPLSGSLSQSDLKMIAETRPDMLLHMIRKDHIFDADKIETIFAYAKACALAELTENTAITS